MNTIKFNTIGTPKANAGGGGGGNTPSTPKPALAVNDVTFYDYDGTILHSYMKDAFLALAEMPTLPTRQGLTCQGWNYDIEDAKAYVEENGKLDVGATYITDDGKTRLYITIAAEGRMNVPLRLQQSVSKGVVVDWGDGSATETFASTAITISHTYGKVGDYVITLEVLSGTLTLSGSSSYGIFANSLTVYGNMLRKAEIGNGVSIGSSAFYMCNFLESIVIPNTVTSFENSTFSNCTNLASIVIPKGVASLEYGTFFNCGHLASIVIPNSVTSIGFQAFSNTSLPSIVIPNGVTSIADNLFTNCTNLVSIAIPNSVTSIGSQVFRGCNSVVLYDFHNHTSVPTLTATNALSSIAGDCKIVVPDALYDEWIAATNWSSYASKIVKASEFNG